AICLHIVEQRFNLRAVHQRSFSRAAANMRVACSVTCLSETELAAARRRQSSYSGLALAISPDGQRAILMRTGPHIVWTSLNSRARDTLFSIRQCMPIVVVS